VFLTWRLREAAIWATGVKHVEPTRQKPVLARADVTPGQIESKGLRVASDFPPLRHSVIVGWRAEKSLRMIWMMEIAKEAVLHLRT
jgi:hypothetical protein